MKVHLACAVLLVTPCVLSAADEVSTFKAYVDSDICARVMLGPIGEGRVSCSKDTAKDGAEPVLVRLNNNLVLSVNKQKMIRPMVGQFAEVTGELKVQNGTIKMQSANPTSADSIPAGDPARKLLDVRSHKATGADAKLYEAIRHELAMMPYITVYDFLSFSLNGRDVILTGWTVMETNRSTAYNIVKNIEGVDSVVNNIDVLPLGSMDMQIRAAARAALQRNLSRYFWGSGSDIKIIVKNGQIILLGIVANKTDSDIAYMRCNGIPGAFKVFNLLRVENGQEKGKS